MYGDQYQVSPATKQHVEVEENIQTKTTMDSQRGAKCFATPTPRSQPKAYCEIMNSFSGLASDLVKIPDMCEFWLGLIQSAKNIIHETPCSERQSSMLALTDKARSATASVVTGKTTAKSASIVLEK